MEPWKKHSAATGGYFQCNRYEVSNKVNLKENELLVQAEEDHNKAAELNKFVHYYTRFKNHENSYKIEEPLLQMAKTKFDILVAQQQPTVLLDHQSPVEEKQQQQKQQHNLNQQPVSMAVASETSSLLNSGASARQHTSSITSRISKSNMVHRMSCSLEKSVFKILNAQEWNILLGEKEKSLEAAANTGESNHKEAILILSKKNNNDNNNNNNNNNVTVAQDETQEEVAETSMSISTETKNRDEPHFFIEEAIRELLRSRRILRCSYVYGYYLDTFGHKKYIIFFFIILG